MPEVPAPTSRPVPLRVGRYEVVVPIASGGMATVYLARSQGARGFARDVALKLTHAHLADETSDFAAILLEEARIASRIRHRNVVSILDVGEDPLGLFLVMDYVEGDTLAGLNRTAAARSETVPIHIGVRMLLDALAGLHAAHELVDEQGVPMAVVHRDFSPQNILIGLDGVAQLADFGIAKASDRAGETETGIVKGKVAYMSPEHARSQPIDRRADVWSAGVVAWEMFAGRRLYPSKEGLGTLLKVVSERPPPLGAVVNGIGSEVEDIVCRALQPNLDLRCPTAAVLARDLGNAFGVMGRLAEHEEVAEFVRRMAGPKLEKRRAHVLSARKLKAEMVALAEDSIAESTQRTPDVPDRNHPAIDPLTETASTTDSLQGSPPPRGAGGRGRIWIGGIVALAVATSVLSFLFDRSSKPTPSERTVDSASATIAAAVSVSAPTETPPPPSSVAAPPTASAPSLPSAPVAVPIRAKTQVPPMRPSGGTPPRPAAAPAPRKESGDIPPNPFGTP
jgi:serine/threonine protein kinase